MAEPKWYRIGTFSIPEKGIEGLGEVIGKEVSGMIDGRKPAGKLVASYMPSAEEFAKFGEKWEQAAAKEEADKLEKRLAAKEEERKKDEAKLAELKKKLGVK